MDTRPLLTLKLSIPATPEWLLSRARLTSVLLAGLQRRLTALIAPAGYGKSTTLAAFFSNGPVATVWLQLDERDNDLPRLVRYLAEGIRAHAPGPATLAVLGQSTRCTVADVDEVLAGDLGRCPDLALVLDDLHLLDPAGEAVALVRRLLEIAPPQVHFFIASRRPLPFPVARLKAQQQAVELTEAQLRFAPVEMEEALSVWVPGAVGPVEKARLAEQTEGWPAALVLVAEALRRGSCLPQISGNLPEDLLAFLVEEVLPGLPAALQSFLEQTSILAVCTPEFCDALLGSNNSAAILAELAASHPLITRMQEGAVRYHALLRQILEERLWRQQGGALARRLHVRAGELYSQHGLIEEAVAHYLRAGDLNGASALVVRLAPRWINSRQTDQMRPILEMLPPAAADTHPWLGVCAGWVRFHAGDVAAARALADQALAQFTANGDRRGHVHALLLIASAKMLTGDGAGALATSEQVECRSEPEWRQELAFALNLKATVSVNTGGPPAETVAALERARTLYVESGDLAGEATACEDLGLLCMRMGDQHRAITLMERAAEIRYQLGNPPSEVGFNLAWAYYSVGRLESARSMYETILQGSVRKSRRANAALNLISVYARLGRFTDAFSLAATAASLVAETARADHRIMVRVALAAAYRLAGQYELALNEVRETLRQAASLGNPLITLNTRVQAALLHLTYTGDAAAVRRIAARALREVTAGFHPKEYTLLLLTEAVAAFRQDRSGARADAVRRLQLALGDCLERGFEALVLQEWPLGLSVVVYGLAFGVLPDYCAGLLRTMAGRLPAVVRSSGIALPESDARHLPAAWRALTEADRGALVSLLTPEGRRRLEGLGVEPVPLRIACIGPLTVQVGDRTLEPGALRKRKVGALLVLLLSRERWPREQLLEALWPDQNAAAADASLRVALHHLRRLLEPHLGGRDRSRYLYAEGGLLWLERQPEVSVDLDAFHAAWECGKTAAVAGDAEAAVRHFVAARSLYRGPLHSDDPYTAALEAPRHQVQQSLEHMLHWLGEHFRASGDMTTSVSCYRQLLALDPVSEPAYQGLLRTYLAFAQWRKAREAYEECRRQLQQTLSVEPSPAIQALYGQIPRQQLRRSGVVIPINKEHGTGSD